MVIAVAAFHTAHGTGIGWLLLPGAVAILEVSHQASPRRAFYALLLIGLMWYGPQLGFFWTLFGPAAITLWLVLAFWVGLFGALTNLTRRHLGETLVLILAPVLWLGIEYFRSELYYLRFSWLTWGMAFHATPGLVQGLGVYGAGFMVMALGAVGMALWRRKRWSAGVLAAAVVSCVLMGRWPAAQRQPDSEPLAVAGVQLEFPNEPQVLFHLDRLIEKHPEARLFMLSEYTFDGPPPARVREWCRQHHRYLVTGGKEMLGETNFYNTAFVVGPDGEIVHRQIKRVPIQFFKDGLPSPDQAVWHSPWGAIGLLVCYDLSYARVVDELVRQGARALLVPTMDVADWGRHQHELHARVAPLRAAEYQVPVFRVCSSGISQLVTAKGEVIARAGFPGEEETITGQLPLTAQPRPPLDRTLGPIAVAFAALTVGALVWQPARRRKRAHDIVPSRREAASHQRKPNLPQPICKLIGL
jgi:apolipoprotein N-acyltransferase